MAVKNPTQVTAPQWSRPVTEAETPMLVAGGTYLGMPQWSRPVTEAETTPENQVRPEP